MKISKSFVRYFFAVVLLAVAPSAAHAAGAKEYLKEKQVTLTALVETNPESPKVVQALDELLDYDSLAKESLGDHGKNCKEECEEFKTLLVKLVQRAYKKSIKETLDFNIEFLAESDAAGGKKVSTVAKHKTDSRKKPVSIEYLVHQVDGKWRIYDIITEEVSLVTSYRSQFGKVIANKGISGLLEVMRKKAAEK